MTSSCPRCQSESLKRNGFTRHGKQNHRCLDCGKQFSSEPSVSILVVREDDDCGNQESNSTHMK